MVQKIKRDMNAEPMHVVSLPGGNNPTAWLRSALGGINSNDHIFTYEGEQANIQRVQIYFEPDSSRPPSRFAEEGDVPDTQAAPGRALTRAARKLDESKRPTITKINENVLEIAAPQGQELAPLLGELTANLLQPHESKGEGFRGFQ